ncbi:MAG: hypothetical protein JKY86_15015 [Gammaproteobacteria bacterium]|nr:hypothetical protein [Gammaproteobacteria bacterium]
MRVNRFIAAERRFSTDALRGAGGLQLALNLLHVFKVMGLVLLLRSTDRVGLCGLILTLAGMNRI